MWQIILFTPKYGKNFAQLIKKSVPCVLTLMLCLSLGYIGTFTCRYKAGLPTTRILQ